VQPANGVVIGPFNPLLEAWVPKDADESRAPNRPGAAGAASKPSRKAPQACRDLHLVPEADAAVSEAAVGEFDALVLPGGTINADHLRTIPEAVALIKGFVDRAKPVAAICHGPWGLVEAGAVVGKTLTIWPSLQTDIRNAGGTWVDQEVKVCGASGWTLVTSRKPDDLDAFCAQLLVAFS
jgi:putative intracellular protease/amidase